MDRLLAKHEGPLAIQVNKVLLDIMDLLEVLPVIMVNQDLLEGHLVIMENRALQVIMDYQCMENQDLQWDIMDLLVCNNQWECNNL